MKSIAFPNFLTSTGVKVIEDNEACESNLKLLLLSQKKQLFGDPAFGTKLIELLHNQNDGIIVDIAIDYIYSSICTFMPQLYVERRNINITQEWDVLYASFLGTNQLNYTTNLYKIALTEDSTK